MNGRGKLNLLGPLTASLVLSLVGGESTARGQGPWGPTADFGPAVSDPGGIWPATSIPPGIEASPSSGVALPVNWEVGPDPQFHDEQATAPPWPALGLGCPPEVHETGRRFQGALDDRQMGARNVNWLMPPQGPPIITPDETLPAPVPEVMLLPDPMDLSAQPLMTTEAMYPGPRHDLLRPLRWVWMTRRASADQGIGYERIATAPFVLDIAQPMNQISFRVDLASGWGHPDRSEAFWAQDRLAGPALAGEVRRLSGFGVPVGTWDTHLFRPHAGAAARYQS